MKCPADAADLVMSERNGIEIDYCPKCRGVWLDRGELDKIIERSEQTQSTSSQSQQSYQEPNYPQHGSKHGGDYSRKKRGSFLGELFD